jgi:hypothetical protein
MHLYKIYINNDKIFVYYNEESFFIKLMQEKLKKVTSIFNNSPQEEMLNFLSEAKVKLNEETLKEIDVIFKKFLDESKEHTCNLCKHYSLLNLFCNKTNKFSKSKDHCCNWEK